MTSAQTAVDDVELVDIASPADPLVELPVSDGPRPKDVAHSQVPEGMNISSSGQGTLPSVPMNRRRPDSQRVTMVGTVMRGSSSGQPIEVEVELTEREYQLLTSKDTRKLDKEECHLGLRQGPHIVLFSFLSIPFALIISLCLSFYNGSLTWYNLFIYFSEEKSIVHRVTICPVLILSFPILVGLSSVTLALVASVLQISWSWVRWKMEIRDGEKGFYGWFCGLIHLPDCSPYQVVILEDANSY